MVEKGSAAELAKLREESRARADEAFDQMFGRYGQNGLVTSTEREDRACEATGALARWLMQEHSASDPTSDRGRRWNVNMSCGLFRSAFMVAMASNPLLGPISTFLEMRARARVA